MHRFKWCLRIIIKELKINWGKRISSPNDDPRARKRKKEERKKEEKEGNSEPRLRYKRIEMKRFESALLVRSFDLPSFRPSPLPRLPLPRPLPRLEWIACVHGKALLVMVAHAVTTTREKQEERYTLRLRLWRAALLTIINMIAIIREPACVLIASQRPPWTMAIYTIWGRCLFLPLIFREDFFFSLNPPFAKGWFFLAANRVFSCVCMCTF